jgi:hypothetical protein
MLDSDGQFCRYLNYYRCDHADSLEEDQPESVWVDQWSCTCNDKCPVCNHEIEPYKSDDLLDDGETEE